ncbi:glutathione peroxidase [Crocinitomix catalasitica]|uniref:glutathione peroxidase n=1 Tax=Crocinitomix catalasitica TaxID=184607 RepID=UPI0004816DB9|nr:glutathione peroxidase [Crocinitomix catalasitica]
MKYSLLIIMFSVLQVMGQTDIYGFKFTTLNGEEKTFSEFKGKKILIVNTASACGFTPQYEGLQELHKLHGDQLVIIGFPANEFGSQEPGSNNEIAAFCQKNYGVEFLMAEKSIVKGDGISDLFNWLTTTENSSFDGPISWNFEKFMINEKGMLEERFKSNVSPISEEILKYIK